jgi:hypothetical protein
MLIFKSNELKMERGIFLSTGSGIHRRGKLVRCRNWREGEGVHVSLEQAGGDDGEGAAGNGLGSVVRCLVSWNVTPFVIS